MRQQLHNLGEKMDKERQAAAADVERVKLEKENKKLRAQIKQMEKEKQAASADKERHKPEKENKKLKAQLEVQAYFDIRQFHFIVSLSLQMMKQQLKQKDEELRNTSTDSTKEVMIFRRRAELAEGAAKSSRDKANQLEDVSKSLILQKQLFTGELANYRVYVSWKLNYQFSRKDSQTWYRYT